MQDPRKWLLFGAIVFVVGMFTVTIMRDWSRLTGQTASIANPTPVLSAAPSKTQVDFSNWTLFRNGYALPVPSKWKNTSDVGGVAVLEAGELVGSLDQITVTILSDKKAPQGQQFTTQKELDEWTAVNGLVQGNLQKTKNIVMDRSSGVLIVDTTSEPNKWFVMAWTRKDSINVQLRFMGNGTYTDTEMQAVDYIVSHFTFTAPEATDSKDADENQDLLQ